MPILINLLRLVSSTVSSIPILMNCLFLPPVFPVPETDHPDSSGSVCLDVINQTWSPMYDMINIFEVFLPQLLRYPNPTDPLNGEAAALLLREPKTYEAKVKEYVARYASKNADEDADKDDESEEEMSSVGDFNSDGEDEPAGAMEDV